MASFVIPSQTEAAVEWQSHHIGQKDGFETVHYESGMTHAFPPGETEKMNVHGPMSMSIMDQFFVWQRTRQNQEVAEQVEMQDDEGDDPLGDPWEAALQREHGDLTLLEHRGGERIWRFYRANSMGLDRPLALDIRANAAMTIQTIRRSLYRTWPDLTNLNNAWRVTTVHRAVYTSTRIPRGTEVFLVHVDAEIDDDQTQVLFELQSWRLGLKSFRSTIVPRIVRRHKDISEFLYSTEQGHKCNVLPCTLRINGVDYSLPQMVPVTSGSLFVSMSYDRMDAITEVVGNYVEDDYLELLPMGFQQLTGITMAIGTHTEPDSFHFDAYCMQRSLASTYHYMYQLQYGNRLTDQKVQIIAATAFQDKDKPQAVSILQYDMGTERLDGFAQLMSTLVVEDMTEDPWSKQFLTPHPAVQTLDIDHSAQTVFLRPSFLEQPKRMIVVEVTTMTQMDGSLSEDLREMMIVFSHTPAHRNGMLLLTDLAPECRRHACLLLLNERFMTEINERHLVPDGSVLKIRMWLNQADDDMLFSDGLDNTMEHETTSEMETSLHMDHCPGRDSTGTFSYVPGTLGNTMMMTCFIASLLGSPTTRRYDCGRKQHRMKKRWWWTLLVLALCMPVANALQVASVHTVHRIGEAKNPGPDFWIGTVNPTGMRGKEDSLAKLPDGLWGITETHLSGVNSRTVVGALKQCGRERGRSLNVVQGAILPLRARSQTAGTWAGVLTMTDWQSRPIQTQWPNQEYKLGRVQIVQSWCGPFTVTGACMYGWAKSPTWPNALKDTNLMFDTVVQEMAISRNGPRYIMGDLNHGLHDLRGFSALLDLGWKDAQDVANERWGQEYLFTCKGTTITDHILLSPELVTMMQEVKTFDWFADHSALGIRLTIPCTSMKQKVWTMPGAIPWESLRKDEWFHADHKPTGTEIQDLDRRVEAFAKDYEKSFDHHLNEMTSIPNHCRGRCQRRTPDERMVTPPLLKPSRPGEVQMSSESLGRTVQRWFRQLRRIQSLLHSVRADRHTIDCQLYRIEVWRSIRRAKGFAGGFPHWWTHRPTHALGLGSHLPEGPPSLGYLDAMFHDFQINYRRLESWHARNRAKLLKAQYSQYHTKIFEVTKQEPKGGISYLEKHTDAIVLGTSEEGNELQVDRSVPCNVPLTVTSGAYSAPGTATSPDVIQLDADWLLQPGQEIEVAAHFTTPPQVHEELRAFWQKKWWKDSLPTTQDWKRIFDFAIAFLPKGKPGVSQLTTEAWVESNTRYGPRSARGPDGIDRNDLRYMPPIFQQELVDILSECETRCQWPKCWRKGFVHSLAKKDGAVLVGEFRPVIIYSMIYRSWSSCRAHLFLQLLNQYAGAYQFGFLPNREPCEMWLATQGLIETGLQQSQDYLGFVTDLRKAFETLPREPLRWLAHHFGLPTEPVELWFEFLATTERCFVVQGEISEPVFSNHGMPEGCALSCTGMVMAGLALHAYMRIFSPSAITLSFVDNIELLSTDMWSLQKSINCLQTWADMWMLELDEGKSFTWATNTKDRQQLPRLQWKVETSAKDLGAQMVYGAKKSITAQKKRIDELQPLWVRLKRCVAPQWQKLQLLYVALWPRAFYGVSICTLGWGHVKTLRTQVMKAMQWSKAGANSGLRLAILHDAKTDPGYYQAHHVLTTFRRMAIKQPGIVDLWTSYMEHYDGKVHQGPFSKLLEICQQLRWTLEPPNVLDRHGNILQWLTMDDIAFSKILEEAWTWKIWEDVSDRKDFQGLFGIDKRVVRAAQAKLAWHHKSTIAVLQDGTFVEARYHAKYDLSKQAQCPLCGEPDSLEHRCTSCSGLTDVYCYHEPVLRQWSEWTPAKRLHLLPSANPFLKEFRHALAEQKDQKETQSRLTHADHLDVFTDGSCIGGEIPEYSLGAWAVVDPSLDTWVARGILGGHRQSCDRAELRAIAAALEYGLKQEKDLTIWTDSTYCSDGVIRLLRDLHDIPDSSNQDDWLEIQGMIQMFPRTLRIQHVAGHGCRAHLDNDVSDWTTRWNDRADREAASAHHMRRNTLTIFHQLWKHHNQEVTDLINLQNLHLEIAERYQSDTENIDDAEEDMGEEPGISDTMVERGCPDCPDPFSSVDLNKEEAKTKLEHRFGRVFTTWFLNCLLGLSNSEDSTMMKMSYLEVAAYVAVEGKQHLPLSDPYRPNAWVDRGLVGGVEPTLGAILRMIKAFLHDLEICFSLSFTKWSGLNLLEFGVHTPQTGLAIPCSLFFRHRATRALGAFTWTRPIRVVNDLARPLRI